jgi:hypothetical protein
MTDNIQVINAAVDKLTALILDRAKRSYIGFTTTLELSQQHVTFTALSTNESFFLPGICHNLMREHLNEVITKTGKVEKPFVMVLKQTRSKMQLTIRRRTAIDNLKDYLGIKPLKRFKHKVIGHGRLYDNYPHVDAVE